MRSDCRHTGQGLIGIDGADDICDSDLEPTPRRRSVMPRLADSVRAALLLFVAAILTLPLGGTASASYPQVRFSRPPLYSLTRDAGDPAQLFDGHTVLGQMWSSRQAVGWYADRRPISLSIDLGAQQALGRVCVRTARRQAAGVSFPARIHIFSSADGQRFGWEADATAGQDLSDGEYLVREFCSRSLDRRARFLELVVETRPVYFFTDEIRIEPPRQGAPVRSAHAGLAREDLVRFALERRSIEDALRSLSEAAAVGSDATSGRAAAALSARMRGAELARDDEGLADVVQQIRRLVRDRRSAAFAGIRLRAADPFGISSRFDGAALPDAVPLDLPRCMHGAVAAAVDNAAPGPVEVEVSAQVEGGAANGIRLQLFAVESVLVADGRTIGDPLVPLRGRLAIPMGESRQIWIDVAATGAAIAGEARIRLRVSAGPGQSREIVLPVRVRELPGGGSEPATVVWGYLDSLPIRNFRAAAAADMLAHGINTAVLPSWDIPWPRAGRSGGAGNYARFDETMRLLSGHQRYLFFFGMEGGRDDRRLGGHSLMSPEWRALFEAWIREWIGRLRGAGLGYDDFALYPVDEVGSEASRLLLIAVSRLAKAADPNVRIYATLNRPEMLTDELLAAVDIFQLNDRAATPELVARLRRAGKTVWLYDTDGGKGADPSRQYRAQAWRAFAWGATGFGFWSYADAGLSGSAWDDLDDVRPDFTVVYDGPNGILSSRRWEAWRQGVQDHRLLSAALASASSGAERNRVMALARQGLEAIDNPAALARVRAALLTIAERGSRGAGADRWIPATCAGQRQ